MASLGYKEALKLYQYNPPQIYSYENSYGIYNIAIVNCLNTEINII